MNVRSVAGMNFQENLYNWSWGRAEKAHHFLCKVPFIIDLYAEYIGWKLGEPFTIDIKIIRKRTAAIGKNKSVGPDSVSREILKLGGEATIPYLARLLGITMNNGTLPGDWKRATVFPIHKGVVDH